MRMKSVGRLEHILKNMIWIIFAVLIVGLLLLCIAVTAVIDSSEDTVFVWNRWWLQLVVLAAALGFSWYAAVRVRKRHVEKPEGTQNAVAGRGGIFVAAVLAVGGIAAVIWILITRLYPTADQESVMAIAAAMLAGDYSAWEPAGYMDMYPFQNGIVLFYYGLMRLFGTKLHVTLQLINVPFYVIAVYAVYRIVMKLWQDNRTGRIALLLLVLWFPMSMYTTFIYGTMIGLCGAVVSLWLALEYMDAPKLWKLLLSCIFMALAVLLKSNYSIFMAAQVIMLLIDSIHHREPRRAGKNGLFIVLIVVIMLLCRTGCNAVTEHITGVATGKGIPKTAWVAMGLRNDYYGWWDGYNQYVYKRNHCDYDAANREALQTTVTRAGHLLKRPTALCKFLVYKTASQWCNPTFQGICIQNSRSSSIELSPFVQSVLSDDGTLGRIAELILDMVQTLVYAGTAFWLMLDRKNINLYQLLPAILFIGGFLFHLVWEAKCQYTIVYFYLIIPYAVLGFRSLTRYLRKGRVKG